MYPTLLKNRILTGFWFCLAVVLAGVFVHSYCAVRVGEICDARQMVAQIVACISLVLCVILLLAYLFGYRWWGINRRSWRHERAATQADRPYFRVDLQTHSDYAISLRELGTILAFLGVVIGSTGFFIKCGKPSAFPYVVAGNVQALDAVLKGTPAFIREINGDGLTLLMTAVRSGHGAMVEYILSKEQDLNQMDDSGRTAVSHAIGQPKIIEMLLQAGASPNGVNHSGVAPLDLAIQKTCRASCSLLLEYGAGVDGAKKELLPPLFRAITGAFDVYDLLLCHGADPNAADQTGETPLHYAAKIDNSKAAQALILFGADPTKVSDKEWSPLHLAVLYDSFKVVTVLLNAGVDVDLFNERQQTPLSCAIHNGKRELAELLIHKGADIDFVDRRGNTYLHDALLRHDHDMAQMLIEHEADLEIANDAGVSPEQLMNQQDWHPLNKTVVYNERK